MCVQANSAILNSLLTILNEREYDDGSRRLQVPLLCAVGASNELPESEELEALYDRFLLRRFVQPVADDFVLQLLDAEGAVQEHAASDGDVAAAADFRALIAGVRQAAIPEAAARPWPTGGHSRVPLCNTERTDDATRETGGISCEARGPHLETKG